MSRSFGRLLFIGFIGLYSTIYYVECRALPDDSEKMTITAVFWLFVLFAVIESVNLIRGLMQRRNGRPLFEPETIRKIVADSKTHLGVLIIIYLMLIPHLGFYVTSFVAFCVFSYVLGTRGVLRVIIPGIVVLAFIYVTFSMSLKLILPAGLLF